MFYVLISEVVEITFSTINKGGLLVIFLISKGWRIGPYCPYVIVTEFITVF